MGSKLHENWLTEFRLTKRRGPKHLVCHNDRCVDSPSFHELSLTRRGRLKRGEPKMNECVLCVRVYARTGASLSGITVASLPTVLEVCLQTVPQTIAFPAHSPEQLLPSESLSDSHGPPISVCKQTNSPYSSQVWSSLGLIRIIQGPSDFILGNV